MSGSAASRILRGVGANILSVAINFLERFLLVPFFISAWNSQVYGVWLSLIAAMAVLSIIDSSYQTALANELCRLWYTEKPQAFRDCIKSALIINLAWQLLISAVFLGLSWSGHIFGWLSKVGLSELHRPSLVLFSIFILCNGFNTAMIGVLSKIFGAVGRFAEGTLIGTGSRVLISICFLIGLQLKFHIPQMMLILLACNLIYLGLLVLRTGVYWLDTSWRYRPSFANALHVFRPAMLFLPSTLALWAHISGIQLLTMRILGPAETVVVATTKTLSGAILMIPPLLAAPLLPELTRIFSIGNPTRGLELVMVATQVFVPTCALLAALGGIFGPVLYSFWLKGQVPWHPELFSLYCIQVLMFSFHYCLALALASQNRMRFVGLANLVSAGIAITVGFLGLKFFGLVGAALGSALGETAVAVLVQFGLNREHTAIYRGKLQSRARTTYSQVLGLCLILLLATRFPTIGFSVLGLISILLLCDSMRKTPEIQNIMNRFLRKQVSR